MKSGAVREPRVGPASAEELPYLYHPSFEEADAEQVHGGPQEPVEECRSFLSDEATREYTRRMHYAAWRVSQAVNPRERSRWRRRYFECRDRIILGNRKLTFRAVQKWSPPSPLADDMTSECQLVLIKAVAAYNPWLGIRFSTYVFTCLMRALSRLSQRQAADRLWHSVPLEDFPERDEDAPGAEREDREIPARLNEFLQARHTLLTPREKLVLISRFSLDQPTLRRETLEQVGHKLGLSKERVRQLQSTALKKLREALLGEAALG